VLDRLDGRGLLFVGGMSLAYGFSQAVAVQFLVGLLGLFFSAATAFLVAYDHPTLPRLLVAFSGLVPAVLIAGVPAGISFLQMAGCGLLIGWSVARGSGAFKVVLLGALPILVVSGLFFFTGDYHKRVGEYRKYIAESFKLSLTRGRNVEIPPEKADEVERLAGLSADLYVRLLPTFLVLSSLISAFLVYLLVTILLIRQGMYITHLSPFGLWRMPESAVYIFIIGLALLLLRGSLRTVGLNLVALMLLGHLVTGLAVIRNFIQVRAFPAVVQALVFLAVFLIQPFGFLFAWGLGLSDVWLNFRHL